MADSEITIESVAHLAKCCTSTVERALRRGEIPYRRRSRAVINLAEAEAWISRRNARKCKASQPAATEPESAVAVAAA